MHLHFGVLLELWSDFDYMLLKQLVALFSARVYWIKQQLPKHKDEVISQYRLTTGESFVVKCCVLLKIKLCPSDTWMVKRGKCRRFWFYWLCTINDDEEGPQTQQSAHKCWRLLLKRLFTAMSTKGHSNVKKDETKKTSFKTNERLK